MGIRAKIEEIRSQTGLSNVRLDQLRNSVRALRRIEEKQADEINRLRAEVEKNTKEINRLRAEQRKETERRDVWAIRDAEVQYLA